MANLITNVATIGDFKSNAVSLEYAGFTISKVCNGYKETKPTNDGDINEYAIHIFNILDDTLSFEDQFKDVIDEKLTVDTSTITFNGTAMPDSYDEDTRTITIDLPDLEECGLHIVMFKATTTIPSSTKK